MTTKYPNQIDDSTSLPPATGEDATSINANIGATEAIETELGVTPSGIYASVRTRLDILESRINNPLIPSPDVLNPFFISGTGVTIQTGSNDPNNLALPPASAGSLYLRQDGYNDQSLYTFGTDGYWHQVSISFATNHYLSQPTWYIDPINGSDSWDGTASTFTSGRIGPIKTAAEYLRRTGLYRPLAIAVQIYIMNDLPIGDPLIITATRTANAGKITVTGINMTPIITGTIDSFTNSDPATNALCILNDASVVNWTPYAGKLLRMTSGPHSTDGGSCWIDKDLGGGAGNARVSQPNYKADIFYSLNLFVPTVQNYEVITPRLLGGGLVVDVLGDPRGITFTLEWCKVPPFFSANVLLSQISFGLYFKCHFDTSLLSFSESVITRDVQASTFALISGGLLDNSGGFFNNLTLTVQSGAIYNNTIPILIEAGALSTGGNQATGFTTIQGRSGGSFQMSNTTNYWNLQSGAQLVLRGSVDIYGTTITGTAYNVGVGSQILMTSPTSLRVSGTVNDIVVGGKTQVFPYVTATGLPQAAVQTCSLANFVNPAIFNGNIHDPFTGIRVLSGLV